ncbi:glycosyltransferase [Curtobacterium flaccumfaciens pv. beticola]|uniref:glycosyltransferase family 2 protein n=1 Tax=Curtobacterium flaccumfaciens TaxID=2035 RepID=UPI00349F1FD8|nr:glycosyltransferase [Curtobacterium flaccumfaciens pv. basellae]
MIVVAFTLLGAGSLLLLIAVYPYVIYPLVLSSLPAAKAQDHASEGLDAADVAVLFSAYNESSSAASKVLNLQKLLVRSPGVEVRIYDDGSQDDSAEQYSRLGSDVVTRGEGRGGKASGLAKLVASSDRAILIFTDANVMLDEAVVERALDHFRDPSIGAICGRLIYEMSDDSATEIAGGLYWRLEERIKQLESRTGSVMGGDGSIFAIRRCLYPEVPKTAQDDFFATMNVVFRGYRLVKVEDVVARERLVSRSRDEYRRKVRIAARAVHTHKAMKDGLRAMSSFDRWKYVSHKLLRWFGIFFLAGAAVCFLMSAFVFSALIGVLSVTAAVLALCAIVFLKKLGAVREILLALVATGHGALLALRGATFATWNPPASR